MSALAVVLPSAPSLVAEPPLEVAWDDWRDRGHRLLVGSLRRALASQHPVWAQALDEHALLDPLLVACARQRPPALPLAQCAWGYLPSRLRPSELPVRVFEDGRVLLPGVGLFEGAMPRCEATLCLVDGKPRLREHPHARLRALPEVEGLPVYPHRHPLLRHLAGRDGEHYERVRVSEPTRHNVVALAEALRLLAAGSPHLHAELMSDVRMCVVLEHHALASSAPASLHGAVLLVVRGHESPLYFVEALVEQGCRIGLGEVAEAVPLLAISAATPMIALGGDVDDERGLGEAQADNYALARVLLALEPLLDHAPLRGHLRHELLGRIAHGLRRLGRGLAQVDHPGFFTEQGLALHRMLRRAHARLHGRLGGLLRALDVSDQPTVFQYERFLANNPR